MIRKWFIALCCLLPLTGFAQDKVLHIYNWSEYLNPDLITAFEEQYDCRVKQDYFDSNEALYAKLKAGAGGYDLIFPSSYMVSIMAEQGMLQELNHDLIPNLKHIDRSFLKLTEDRDMKYSVQYMVGSTGIGYIDGRVEMDEPSWAIFANEEYAGRMTLLNDMREVIGAALKYLGYSLNTTDEAQLDEAAEVAIAWKKNIAKYESEQYKNGLVSLEFLVSQGYSGDVMQGMEENEDIAYVIPKEGTSLYSDDMAIPVGAENAELAHAFINFLHEPENAASNTDFVWYLCPNTASYEFLSEEVKEDPAVFLDPEVVAKSEVIRDLGEENAKYVKVWDRIKAAQ